jgi:16S rRNA (uracil1498-N3)-methyltransferase
MAEPWLLVAPGVLVEDGVVPLDDGEARHAGAVRRLGIGSEVILADGAGAVAHAVLTSVDRRRLEARVLRVDRTPADEGEGVVLALAALHSQAMDWAVQKAVEVGVRCLVPVVTTRVQLAGEAIGGRLGHWRRIARQALKQCRRPWAMDIGEPVRLMELVAERGDAGGVVADPQGIAAGELPPDVPGLLLVGPEGGLTEEEEAILDTENWHRLKLGPHTLRADTAAVVGAAILVARAENRRT